MDTSKLKTSHQLAKELLDGPNLPVVVAVPMFDSPGCSTVYSVKAVSRRIQDIDCLVMCPCGPDEKEQSSEPASQTASS